MRAELSEMSAQIMNDPRYPFPLNQALCAVNILAQMKGENLKIFHMQKGSQLCDYNILASAYNQTQIRAMADEISKQFRQLGVEIRSFEGYEQADWVLVDLGDCIVHLFQDAARDLYDLDNVLKLNPQVTIPSEFYFGAKKPLEATATDRLKGYF